MEDCVFSVSHKRFSDHEEVHTTYSVVWQQNVGAQPLNTTTCHWF